MHFNNAIIELEKKSHFLEVLFKKTDETSDTK